MAAKVERDEALSVKQQTELRYEAQWKPEAWRIAFIFYK